jgi:sulfite reductase (ferredoxin)
LPADQDDDIARFGIEVDRFLAGEQTPDLFKAQRVPRGIYEQRLDGTYMLRVRLPGGLVTAAQLRALADLGRQYGSGILHVTTRQDIQFHGVTIVDTPVIMRGLLAAGLTCKGGGGDTVRNVAACPYAGICPCERFDVAPYALAVTEHLIAQPGSYRLPRKYKIAFSGCSDDCALAGFADMGFVARVRDGRPGFAVYAGGGMGAESRVADRLEEWLPAGECLRVAETVRRIFDREGDRTNRKRARLRFAVARLGPEVFADLYRREREVVAADGVPVCEDVAVTPGDPAGRPAGIDGAFVSCDGLRVLPQHQAGRVAVTLHLPLGQVAWPDLNTLADIAERFSGERSVRASASQKLVLRGVRVEDLPALRSALATAPDAWTSGRALDVFTACVGSAVCRLGLCQSSAAAQACAAALDRAGLSAAELAGVDIRVSGCTNACGQHPVGTIGLCGLLLRTDGGPVPGYRVLLGARRCEGQARFGTGVGNVPADALPAFLVELVREFRDTRGARETLSATCARRGLDPFRALTARHASVPSAVPPEGGISAVEIRA